MIGKLKTLRGVSVPVWIIGMIILVCLWAFAIFWLVQTWYSYKPFDLNTRIWIDQGSRLVVDGTCGIEAGSHAKFLIQNTNTPQTVIPARLVSGVELGAVEKVYSMTTYLEPGVWEFVFISDPGPEKPPAEEVEVVAKCLDGQILTNIITDPASVWVGIFVITLIGAWFLYLWTNFLQIRFHKV